jgi:hypothetical protein
MIPLPAVLVKYFGFMADQGDDKTDRGLSLKGVFRVLPVDADAIV